MSEPAGAKPKRDSKLPQPKAASEPAKATKHKKWVKEVETAQLSRLLRHGEAEVAKALKKSGVTYSVQDIVVPAAAPANHQVVLYKSDGKLVGYAVGATSANPKKRAAQKPTAQKPVAQKAAAKNKS